MATTNLPGDWTTRGTVICDRSARTHMTRREALRFAAWETRQGRTLTTCEMRASGIAIVSEHRGYPRAINRQIARRALASL